MAKSSTEKREADLREINHEMGKIAGRNIVALSSAVLLKINGIELYLTHDPEDIPSEWQGWAVHGHKHDTQPLIKPHEKRVNTSVEVLNYKPLRLSSLLDLIAKYHI